VTHNNPEDCWRIGLYSSIAGHVAIVIFSLFGLFGGYGDLPEPVIYSVTVEPGKSLGGKSQLAKDDKPSPISPLKNVKADSSPQEEVKEKQKLLLPYFNIIDNNRIPYYYTLI
jgi:hypothetical protein